MAKYKTWDEAMGNKPELCDDCKQLMDYSLVHPALCGGMRVGMTPPSFEWMMRPKNEVSQETIKANHMQLIASAMRLIHDLNYRCDDVELNRQVEQFVERVRKHL